MQGSASALAPDALAGLAEGSAGLRHPEHTLRGPLDHETPWLGADRGGLRSRISFALVGRAGLEPATDGL